MKIGTKVKNSMGWTGVIVERPKHWQWKDIEGDPVVYVHWDERERMMKDGSDRGNHAIKDAVISAIPSHLTVIQA